MMRVQTFLHCFLQVTSSAFAVKSEQGILQSMAPQRHLTGVSKGHDEH